MKRELKKTNKVVIPTDKTNSYRTVDINKYINWMEEHLESKAIKSSRDRIKDIYNDANKLLDEIEDIINKNEYNLLKETIETKAIPTPKLLIKDHKKPNDKGDYPTRIIIPTTNFTAGFPKLGFSGIKRIFDKNNINYMRKTIIQSSDLKDKLENLNITKSNSTIVSLDIVSFYPSIKFNVVKKAVQHYSKNLTQKEKKIIDNCLNLIQFGMSNTLITFRDKYYEHGGSCNPTKRGLTIGGYESAWLADLVAVWILDNSENLFRRTSHYHGIYRDDGLIVFKNEWSIDHIDKWIKNFQLKVNDLCGDEDLKFTISIWKPGLNKIIKYNEVIEIYGKDYFLYLDLQFLWNKKEELKFKVYMKENQKLKYLNSDSTHSKHCIKAIPSGLFKRLANLTSTTRRKLDTTIDKLYPDHAKALKIAGLTPKKFPKFKELLMKIKNDKENKKIKIKNKRKNRNTYFCIGGCETWSGANSIHITLKKLRNKYNLKWLRIAMSYHKFSNLNEIFQGDLNNKLMHNITSRDFMDLNCNCNRGSMVEGECIYKKNAENLLLSTKLLVKNVDATTLEIHNRSSKLE